MRILWSLVLIYTFRNDSVFLVDSLWCESRASWVNVQKLIAVTMAEKSILQPFSCLPMYEYNDFGIVCRNNVI